MPERKRSLKKAPYSRLRTRLNEFPIGAPESEEIAEILRILFAPAEAEAALCLDVLPKELSRIAEASGRPEPEMRKLLETMADKGLVLKETKTDGGRTIELYGLLPTLPGLYEMSMGKGRTDPRTERLGRLWQDYFEHGFRDELHASKTPLTRVIPVGKSIDSSRDEVLSHEQASVHIENAGFLAVTYCACRHSAALAQKACDRPVEVCVCFGDFARHMAERGYAREITKAEALAILDKTEEAGLVHLAGNFREECLVICSCCPCCCFQLRGLIQRRRVGATAASRFLAVVDAGKCTACAACESRCHFNAIAVKDAAAAVVEAGCMGCGLCVTACPAGALSLAARKDYDTPPESLGNMFMSVYQEKVHLKRRT